MEETKRIQEKDELIQKKLEASLLGQERERKYTETLVRKRNKRKEEEKKEKRKKGRRKEREEEKGERRKRLIRFYSKSLNARGRSKKKGNILFISCILFYKLTSN